jgi:hypothetical protein
LESFATEYSRPAGALKHGLAQTKPDAVVGYPIVFWQLQQLGYFLEPGRHFFALTQDAPAEWPGAVEPSEIEAQRAVEWLDTMIRHGETGVPQTPLHLLVPPKWSDGPPASP